MSNLPKAIAQIISKDALIRVLNDLPEDAEFAFVSFHKDEQGYVVSKIRHSSEIEYSKLHFAGCWISNYAMRQYEEPCEDEPPEYA